MFRKAVALDETVIMPLIVVDRSLGYLYALKKIGLEYIHEWFGRRSIVEKFFGWQRIKRFYNNIYCWNVKSIEDYA